METIVDFGEAVADFFDNVVSHRVVEGASQVASVAKETSLAKTLTYSQKEIQEAVQSRANNAVTQASVLLHDAADWSMENPAIAGGVAVAAGFVLLPGLRQSFIRSVTERLQTDEYKLQTAIQRATKLKDLKELVTKDSAALAERTKLAVDEYTRGMAKMRTMHDTMVSLKAKAKSAEANGKEILYNMRRMQGKEVQELRRDVQETIAGARASQTVLSKNIEKISQYDI